MTEKNQKKKKTQKKVYAKGYGKEKKVTAKQVSRCLYKWLKVYGWELENLKTRLEEFNHLLKSFDERLTFIEEFLGGRKSMATVLHKVYKDEQLKESEDNTNGK